MSWLAIFFIWSLSHFPTRKSPIRLFSKTAWTSLWTDCSRSPDTLWVILMVRIFSFFWFRLCNIHLPSLSVKNKKNSFAGVGLAWVFSPGCGIFGYRSKVGRFSNVYKKESCQEMLSLTFKWAIGPLWRPDLWPFSKAEKRSQLLCFGSFALRPVILVPLLKQH